MTDVLRVVLCLAGAVAGWVATFHLMRHSNPMFRAFIDSKLGRRLISGFLGALAPAVPALVMGDTDTFRIALSSALGALVAGYAAGMNPEAAK